MKQVLPPNLRKDRIVLQLTNRTNEDRTISLFKLPLGINPPQNISYGDLFTTKFCKITVPTSEFGSSKSWTINWIDEDGANQTATFNAVFIGDLINELNNNTGEQFTYVTSGSDYIISKNPIETFFYFTIPDPLLFNNTLPTSKSSATNTYGNPIADVTPSSKVFGGSSNKGFFLSMNSSSEIAFYDQFGTSPTTVKNALIDYGITAAAALVYDTYNEYLWCSDALGTQDSAVINLDASLTLINNLTPSSGLNQKGGYLSFSSKYNKMIQLGAVIDGSSSAMTVWDVTTLTETFSGRPTYSATSLNLGGAFQSVVYDSNGDAWIMNGNSGGSTAENGIFKFENDNWSTATDFISLNTNIPLTWVKRGLLYLNGKFYVVARDNIGNNESIIEVYSENGNLLNSTPISGKLENISYHTSYGNYILITDDNNTVPKVIDLDGNIVENNTAFTSAYKWAQYVAVQDKTIFVASSAPTGEETKISAGIQLPPPSGASQAGVYTENEFTTLVNNTDSNTYTWTCFDVIEGTGISIVETTGNIPYRELVQELRNNIEPYYFETVSVYASTLNQANQKFLKKNRNVTGYSATLLDNPTVIPTQSRFVILEEPISFFPKAINNLDYVVKANESVTLIFNYTKGNLNAIAELIDEYIEEGIPFSTGLNQLMELPSEVEKKYLYKTLEDIWAKRWKTKTTNKSAQELNKLFSETNTEVAIPKPISAKVQQLIEGNKLPPETTLHTGRIKQLIGNYIAKEGADKIHDPYNYANGKTKQP